jgi:hypothetical protein
VERHVLAVVAVASDHVLDVPVFEQEGVAQNDHVAGRYLAHLDRVVDVGDDRQPVGFEEAHLAGAAAVVETAEPAYGPDGQPEPLRRLRLGVEDAARVLVGDLEVLDDEAVVVRLLVEAVDAPGRVVVEGEGDARVLVVVGEEVGRARLEQEQLVLARVGHEQPQESLRHGGPGLADPDPQAEFPGARVAGFLVGVGGVGRHPLRDETHGRTPLHSVGGRRGANVGAVCAPPPGATRAGRRELLQARTICNPTRRAFPR